MYQKYVAFELPNSGFTTSAMSGTSHVGIIQHHLWMFGRDDMWYLLGIEVYMWLCIHIYIIHRYSMYLWWVVNVRWGRFASLLLLCERNLHCGICSGILNPNRPQHAPTQNYLPLVETQYVWDEVKQCTSSNQRGNNTRIPQTVYDIVWSWNTCI